jgi:ribosomal protein S18 acetylase RimI-like enzyme
VDYTIRAATIADARAIVLVHVDTQNQAFKGLFSEIAQRPINLDHAEADKRQKLEQDALGKTCTFVADRSGKDIIGFASGGPKRDGPPEYGGELYNVFVLPEYQHQGIGTALFLQVVEFLRAQHEQALLLWVLKNTAAVAYYERLGGQRITERYEQSPVPMTLLCYAWSNLAKLEISLRSKPVDR